MQRNQIIAIVVALVVTIGAFFTWQHLTRLSDQLGNLSQQVSTLNDQVVTAESQAKEAETRAEAAESASIEAAQRAEAATLRELQSAEEARLAKAARAEAEERERFAAQARTEAEAAEHAQAAARQAAEDARNEAEILQAQQQLKARAAEEEAERAKAETEKVREKLEAELDRLQRALGKIADTKRTALGLVMTLDSSQIEFDFNKAALRPENREVLSRIAGVLLTFNNYSVQVFGHTDDVGSVEYNQRLSEQRAAKVREYLIEAGIDPKVLTTMGLGKSSPLIEGSDPVSRQRNRRVELAIVFSEGEFEVRPEEPAEG